MESESCEKNDSNATLSSQVEKLWQQDHLRGSGPEEPQSESLESKSFASASESNDKKELDLLRHRVKIADMLMSYLKSKAKIMAIPQFAHTSCGIRRQEGVGLVDKRGVPIAEWVRNIKPSFLDRDSPVLDFLLGSKYDTEITDGEYTERIARTIMQVTDIMELLLKRAIIAETDMDAEREKAKASQAEVKQKTLQLESMWSRVREMEKVAINTSTVLKEMQIKLEDMEHETSRQRQRAAENEQELSKVRHDFGMLRSSIENLVTARETIVTLEKRVQEMESISERLSAHVVTLEAGKRRKEAEVAEFLAENDDLRAQLDFKEAELSAMRQQLRMMYKDEHVM